MENDTRSGDRNNAPMLDTMEAPPPLEDDNPIAAEHYGAKKAAIEPGGVERIPSSERHGTPLALLWTWSSPNMEFATIAVGILGPLYWGLSFAQTVAAIVLGTLLGAITQGILSSWGPGTGLCQMVLSRTGFGFVGNALPAGLNAVVAGVGWFAVNSISGALALHALVHGAPKGLCLAVIVVLQLGLACFGHNLVQAFERYALPLLLVVFVAGAAVIFGKSHLSASGSGGTPTVGAFLLMTAAAFGYACGWNPYAADYSRYLPASSSRRRTGLYSAVGLFLSCALLESAGAAMVFAAGKNAAVDPGVYTGLMASWLGKLTLLCIALGAIAANALNIYSGAMSFLTVGLRLPGSRARMTTALVFGAAGFVLALFGLKNAGTNYENFLLVIAYWIGPWLGVVLADRLIRHGADAVAIAEDRGFTNWAGPIAMLVGSAVSIWLFANQSKYVGPVPKAHPAFGDITFFVGFVLSAALYLVLRRVLPERRSATAPISPVS